MLFKNIYFDYAYLPDKYVLLCIVHYNDKQQLCERGSNKKINFKNNKLIKLNIFPLNTQRSFQRKSCCKALMTIAWPIRWMPPLSQACDAIQPISEQQWEPSHPPPIVANKYFSMY